MKSLPDQPDGSVRGRHFSLEERALAALLEVLITGVELLAANLLHEAAPEVIAGRFDGARNAFETVLELSATSGSTYLPGIEGATVLAYAGPHHLASLLCRFVWLSLASLFAVPPPLGVNIESWNSWLKSEQSLRLLCGPTIARQSQRDFIKQAYHLLSCCQPAPEKQRSHHLRSREY